VRSRRVEHSSKDKAVAKGGLKLISGQNKSTRKIFYLYQKLAMPVISMFYGIIVMMYFFDTDKHHLPHIHIKFDEFTCVISIADSEILQGDLPRNKLKLVWAWIELHRDELMANWELAVNGKELFDIKPLQ
jgi:hypothetical protein